MASLSPTSPLLGFRSLLVSLGLFLTPPLLYYLGSNQGSRTQGLVYEALFFLSVAVIFLSANPGSKHVALLAAVRWLCESWATFGRAYRTRFFGTLCLLALAATLFELVIGQKITQYLG
jgi:hypothetical protein